MRSLGCIARAVDALALQIVEGGAGGWCAVGVFEKLNAAGCGAVEGHPVDVAVGCVDGEADDLSPSLEGHGALAGEGAIGAPVVVGSLGHTDAGELLRFAVADDGEGEGCTCCSRRGEGLVAVFACLGYVDGVFEPFAGGGIANGASAVAPDDIYSSVVGAVVGVALVFLVRVVEGEAVVSLVEVLGLDGAGQADHVVVVGTARLVGGEASHALVLSAVGGSDHGLERVVAQLVGGVFGFVGGAGECGDELAVGIDLHLLYGLGAEAGIDGDGQHVACRGVDGLGSHIDGGLLLHAGEGALGLLGGVALHVVAQPGHGKPLGAVFADDARILGLVPGVAIDVAPEGESGAVGSLPDDGNLLFVALQLFVVVLLADVIFGAVHGELQLVVQVFHGRAELAGSHVVEVVRLATVGIDGRSGVAHGAHQFDELFLLPLEGVVVVVDEDGVGPALVGHLESLHNPVVARHAIAAECILVGGGCMADNGFVHHVDHLQVGIALLDGIHPLDNGLVLLGGGEVVHPSGVLGAPNECVELEGDAVFLGVVVGIVASPPVELSAAVALDGLPLRLVLGCDLVPQVGILDVGVVDFTAGGDVAQELVGVRRQLRAGIDREKTGCHGQQNGFQ